MDSFGTQLKHQREKRNISLDDVSAATKISNRFLNAIETDRFDQLPGGIFNRGFVRAYARHLGLDEEQTVQAYASASGEAPAEATSVTDPDHGLESRPATATGFPWGIVAAILLTVIAIVGWMMSKKPSSFRKALSPSSAANPPTGQRQSAETKQSADTVAAPVTGGEKSLPSESSDSDSSGRDFRLQIIARENSWLSVSGPHGQIFHGTLAKLEEKSLIGRERIVIRTGNAAGLDFMWNGQRVTSPGKEGEVRTIVFDSYGAHPMDATPQPATASPAPDSANP